MSTTHDVEFSHLLQGRLENIRKASDMTDVTLKGETIEVKCHKLILSAASPYFEKMFKSGMLETTTNTVHLSSLSDQTLEAIVSYIYSSKVDITSDNVQALFEASHLLQLDRLRALCVTFMQSHLSEGNCIELFHFGEHYSEDGLVTAARKMMLKKFTQVCQSVEFMKLSLQQVSDCISDDELFVQTEDMVLESVLNWIAYDHKEREQNIGQLLDCMRLSFCSNAYLTEVMKRDLLLNRPKCLKLILDSMSGDSSQCDPRNSFSVRRTLVHVGGEQNDEVSYLTRDNKWENLTNLPSHVTHQSVCLVPSGISVTGGRDEMAEGTTECWNFYVQQRKWRRWTPMLTPRHMHSALYHNNHVFAIGGFSSERLNTMEACNVHTRVWCTKSSMLYPINCPVAVPYKNSIYVFGGITACDYKKWSTQCYNTALDSWELKTPSPRDLIGGKGIAIGDKMYVLSCRSNGCFRYDPLLDTWTVLQNMPNWQADAGVALWNDRIIVCGGTTSWRKGDPGASRIYSYDYHSNEWALCEFALEKGDMYNTVLVMNLPEKESTVPIG